MGLLLSHQHPLRRRTYMDNKETKIFQNLNIRDAQND